MPNRFSSLAVPAAVGSGAWTDVSAMGLEKTITVNGAFTGTVTVEVSNDSGTGVAQLFSFTSQGKKRFKVPCQYMRVTRSHSVAVSGTPTVSVGANDDGVAIANLPVSAGDGVGAAVDVDQFGSEWSIIVAAAFTGTVTIEISTDGTNYEPLISTTKTGVLILESGIVAAYARVRRSGNSGGTPNVDIAAVNEDESLVNMFGDGSDGNVTLSSNTTLTRDMYYNNLETAGYDIDCAGFRIFCKNQMNITGNSIIHRDGNAGAAEAAGAARAAAVLGNSAAGGAGATAGGAAGTGIAQCIGAAGGAGGLGAGGAGGAAGAATVPTANEGLPRGLPSSFSGYTMDGTIMKGGTGAGGGGGDGAADEGGGGGGGGGVVMINAKEINVAAAAFIRADGGAGAAGTATNAGGGGGGGGGAVILNYRMLNNLGTARANGGAGGASGGGTGVAGTAGSNGTVYSNAI